MRNPKPNRALCVLTRKNKGKSQGKYAKYVESTLKRILELHNLHMSGHKISMTKVPQSTVSELIANYEKN